MRVVSESTPQEIARQEAAGIIEMHLRELTANLLRVTRGAGKPHLISEQTRDLLVAIVGYRDAVGHYPPGAEFGEMLSVKQSHRPTTDHGWARIGAEEGILRGALQVVASRLLEQPTQERAGESEMFTGVNALQDWREERNREFAKARAIASRAVPRKRKSAPPTK